MISEQLLLLFDFLPPVRIRVVCCCGCCCSLDFPPSVWDVVVFSYWEILVAFLGRKPAATESHNQTSSNGFWKLGWGFYKKKNVPGQRFSAAVGSLTFASLYCTGPRFHVSCDGLSAESATLRRRREGDRSRRHSNLQPLKSNDSPNHLATLKKKHQKTYTLLIPFEKFGAPHLDKATAAARAALPSPISACWVFSCFRNPPNSDMDYRIFNVRTWPFLSVHMHTGGWAHRHRVSTTFLTRKNSISFSCAPDRIQTWVMECEVRCSTNWAMPPTHTLVTCMIKEIVFWFCNCSLCLV